MRFVLFVPPIHERDARTARRDDRSAAQSARRVCTCASLRRRVSASRRAPTVAASQAHACATLAGPAHRVISALLRCATAFRVSARRATSRVSVARRLYRTRTTQRATRPARPLVRPARTAVCVEWKRPRPTIRARAMRRSRLARIAR